MKLCFCSQSRWDRMLGSGRPFVTRKDYERSVLRLIGVSSSVHSTGQLPNLLLCDLLVLVETAYIVRIPCLRVACLLLVTLLLGHKDDAACEFLLLFCW